MAIIRSTLTYGCKARTILVLYYADTTSISPKEEFKNKILRRIRGAIYDSEKGMWRREFNIELQEGIKFINRQSIQ